MPKTDAFSQAVEDLVLQNVNVANVGDATGLRGSGTAGVFYLSLHSSSPGTSGNQGTNEVAYTSYARASVPRSSAGWTRTGDTTALAAAVDFPACTGGSATATYAGIGTASSGAGTLLYFGSITPNISISTGITPELTTGSTLTES